MSIFTRAVPIAGCFGKYHLLLFESFTVKRNIIFTYKVYQLRFGAGAAQKGCENEILFHGCLHFTNSTLRLFALPSKLLLSLIGLVSPRPLVLSRDPSTPIFTN